MLFVMAFTFLIKNLPFSRFLWDQNYQMFVDASIILFFRWSLYRKQKEIWILNPGNFEEQNQLLCSDFKWILLKHFSSCDIDALSDLKNIMWDLFMELYHRMLVFPDCLHDMFVLLDQTVALVSLFSPFHNSSVLVDEK